MLNIGNCLSMNKWWQVSLLLCCYGLFKEYRPSEPYITPFLTSQYKNFTSDQVMQEIYPVGTYCYLSLLIVVFLLTDFLRYKLVLIVGGLSGVVTWSLLTWGKTIPTMQVVEFFYGVFMASEVAYYTYIYAKVDKEHYQKVTSHTRTAFLLGKATAGISSQLFVQYDIFDYLELNYISVGAVAVATLVSFLLPSVPQSIYFHRYSPAIDNNFTSGDKEKDDENNTSPTKKVLPEEKSPVQSKFRNAFYYLYSDLKQAYTNLYVVEWSVWWALATCGYLQIMSNCQVLWEKINEDDNVELYNGLVEFSYSLLGALVTFSICNLKVPWQKWGELALGILTLVQGACIFTSAGLTSLYIAYGVHIGYGILYQAAITIASSEVAKDIREDSYALIFGINTFLALVLQTVLTVVVINYLKYPIRTQFRIYGSCHFIAGGVFLLMAVYTLMKSRRKTLS